MAQHSRFHFKTLAELQQKATELKLSIPVDNDISVLFKPIEIQNRVLTNRFVVHPMEGFDADQTGAPQTLAFRRYQRYAAGGAALIWFEATAILPEARSNPNQFYLHRQNVNVYQKLVAATRQVAETENGYIPLLILQLTHSGRYSKPSGKPQPIIAHHSPILDPLHRLPMVYPLISDAELDALQSQYLEVAALAFEAGFDGVDIKSCHRYLVSELLASFERPDSRYGGSFENRTRFLIETRRQIQQRFPDKIITTRLNVFDAIPHPYGFGVRANHDLTPDLQEPLQLIQLLKNEGLPLINISIGNPYYNPHYGRPYDFPIRQGKLPDEHPLEGIARFLAITRQIQMRFPDLPVIGSGYSWLRHYLPYVAAGVLKSGGATLIGQGRGMFAYPDAVKDLQRTQKMDARKVCVTCSACTQIMRDGSQTGCVVRDSEIYGPIFRQIRKQTADELRQEALRCRDCFTPTCQDQCPAHVHVPEFIKAYAANDIPAAYQYLAQSNLLPEICAYICPAEVQCEGGCIEKIFSGQSVRIRDIQAAVSREARQQGLVHLTLPAKFTGKRVAIVGAGAAGLSCAASLLQKGHQVVLFDRHPQPGGIVRSLLPNTRIRAHDVDAEIRALLGSVSSERLDWRLGTELTAAFNLDQLGAQFDAVFLGIGLTEGVRLFDHPPTGVVDALEFLASQKRGNGGAIPQQVAVIGGGNTALDAAISAQRGGARDVYLIYRRSFVELPAWPAERDLALKLGVHFLILSQPVEYLADAQQKVRAIRLARTQLGEPDASGRRAPQLIAGGESILPVQLVIEAIGQKPPADLAQLLPGVQLNVRGLVAVPSQSQATSRRGVFAGGDLTNGGATAVQAIAEGLRAATEIHAWL